jgi:YfiR/HmsC-like
MTTACSKIGTRSGLSRGLECFLSFVLFLAAPPKLPADSKVEEYSVKAAFLFHFAQFVEWPQGTFDGNNSPLKYCTLGDDPFHGALDAILSGKTIGTRPVSVEHFRQAREIVGCQVLFIGASQKKTIPTALESLKGFPILTVGESEHFVQEGGMIGFFLEDNKVRFEINLTAAERARLKVSARLLSLAKTVIGGPKGT